MQVRIDYSHSKAKDGTIHSRPFLDIVLRCAGCISPLLEILVDTGADTCLFDWPLAHLMGFDPDAVGLPSLVGGIGRSDQRARLINASIHVPALERDFELAVQFAPIPGKIGLIGVLGHDGFLDRLNVTFSQAKYFEIDDELPGENSN